MIIMESAIAMNRDYVECNNSLAKIDLFANTAYREYEINVKEAALKVVKENGSEEDFNFLVTEAAKDYVERAKKAIDKIVEAVKKFIRDCKDRFIKLIENSKIKTAIDKAESLIKSNPKFRSTKIKYEDTDKQAAIIQQGIDSINKKVSKVKAKGIATPEDIEEIDEIESNTMKKVAAISAASVITIGGAILVLRHFSSKTDADKEIPDNYEAPVSNELYEKTKKTIDDIHEKLKDADVEMTTFARKATTSHARLTKTKVSLKIKKPSTVAKAVREAVVGFIDHMRGKVQSESAHEDITFEDLEMFASTYVESTEEHEDEALESEESVAESVGVEEGLDLDQYFNEMCNELFTESEEDESEVDETEEEIEDIDDESVLEDETSESEEVETESTETEDSSDNMDVYMEQLERELFGDDEEVATESSEESDVETSIASLLDEMESLL